MSPSAPTCDEPTGASWKALGSTAVLRLTDPRGLALARSEIESELSAIDLACSRFRADSELSRLNARRGRPTPASPLLVEALEVALRAAELTDGDVDPTVGRALELAGYDRDWNLLAASRDEPEPPMITVEDCFSILRSTPSSTTLAPKRFFTPISSILAVMWKTGSR